MWDEGADICDPTMEFGSIAIKFGKFGVDAVSFSA